MELKKQLNSFWDWAQLTPEEYANGAEPNNSDIYLSEWEDDYDCFDLIINAFYKEVHDEMDFDKSEFIDVVLQAISIDHESEKLAEFAISNLSSISIDRLFKSALSGKYENAQWLLVSKISDSCSGNKKQLVEDFINEGLTPYVRHRAELVMKTL